MPEQRTRWVWRDGEFIAWSRATIHVGSHVVHYGSSVFEGIRCYETPHGPAIFRLREHIRRLFDSARIYRMPIPYGEEELAEACRSVVARNRLDSCYLRPIVIRGAGTFGINPQSCPVETYVLGFPWGTYLGDGALNEGVDACVSSWHRPAPNTLPVMAKAGGQYLGSQLIRMEAVANGYAEGIALAPDGTVSEGSGQNIFLVRDDVLITPAVDGTLLAGITRDAVIRIAKGLGMEVREQVVPREMLYISDEVFFAGTAVEITPVRSIDRIEIGTGPVTRTIQERLLGIARGVLPDEHGWLTPVRTRRRAVA